MYSVTIDQARQLLRVAYSGAITAEDAHHCLEEIRRVLPQLERGFCLLSDLTELQEMEPGCQVFIDQMMDEVNAQGVQRVVRVVPNPDKDIGLGIMSLFHYGRHVRVITCATAEEAAQLLSR